MNRTVDTQQMVIIAKPGPDQPYCQLATAFQNCLCLQSILHPCLNTLRAFSDERHRVGILQELAFAADNQPTRADLMLPADRYYQANEQKNADYRFPYITATLISSMACCVGQEHNCYRCSLEAPFHTVRNAFRAAHDPLYEDCNTRHGGIVTVAVIDITDLRKLRYCFLNMPVCCIKCGLRSYRSDRKTIIDVYDGDLPEWEMADYTPSDGEPLSYRIDFGSNGEVGPMREGRDVEALEILQAYPLIDVATLASKFICPESLRASIFVMVIQIKIKLLTMIPPQTAGHPLPGNCLNNRRRIPTKSQPTEVHPSAESSLLES